MLKIQRSNKVINSVGEISFIIILLNSLENMKKVDSMRMKNIKRMQGQYFILERPDKIRRYKTFADVA